MAPPSPIQFNVRLCLRAPLVHTRGFGMNVPDHVREMTGAFPISVPLSARDQAALNRLDARLEADPDAAYDG